MNRRKLFSFIALAPVGVIMAKEEVAAKDMDVPVKVTPGEKCIHCGCPQHIMVPDWSYQVVDPGHSHSLATHTLPSHTHSLVTSYQAKKVCSWCNLPWVGKKWEASPHG